ncbi:MULTISPECIES: hypothetical protein [unclassified Bartonella]|uniref:hypothetical protein n=1 Tax=unclassified Bartonella TaxID=2645622 RepID=UPI0035D0B90B
MRGNGKNASLDEELRSFSLEEAFLTSKNYKVIFCIAFIVAALRTALLFLLMWLEWKLAGWEGDVVAALSLIMELISWFIFLFIPVAFVVRIIFTVLLKEKIDMLEQAIWKRRKTASQQNSA